MNDDPLMTVHDIAKMWGVHVRTVRTWIRIGRLATVRTEGVFRVRVRLSVAESALGERPSTTA